MNVFDIITLVALLWAIVSGWRSGFVAQLLSLFGIILGFILAIRVGGKVGMMLGIDPQFAAMAGFAIVFILTIIIVGLVARILRTILSFIGIKWLDMLLGIAFSAIKVTLVLSILFGTFHSLNKEWKLVDEHLFKESVSFHHVEKISESIFPYIDCVKDSVKKSSDFKI